MMRYKILWKVWGSKTGIRSAFLKNKNGDEEIFNNHRDALDRAALLENQMNHDKSVAQVSYMAVESPEEKL